MEDKGFDYLNVIPLVDIMLVLLTIVLTTSTFIVTGTLRVDVPKVTASEPDYAAPHLIIEINQDGLLTVNAQIVTRDELNTVLSSADRNTPVVVRADRNISLQSFVDIYDLVRSLGFSKLSLQTEQEK
ncbi:MAG: biopolymer transporter ExbD [Chlorobium sp.]|nr:biopolymer transporter ExbD [Chlorobium sp.]